LCLVIIVFQVDTDDVADADDIVDDSAVLISKEAVCRASYVDGMTKSVEPSTNGPNNHCMFYWFIKLFNQSKHRFHKN